MHARIGIYAVLAANLIALSGCASYAPKPLPETATLLTESSKLQTAIALAETPTRGVKFNPNDGFDANELAIAAVAANPGLRALRTQHGVASAQLYAAGLLPDPQLDASLDIPQSSGPGLVNAYAIGLVSDIVASLITRGVRRDVAAQALQQVDLGIAWQEWQVAQQARSLYTTLYFLEEKIKVAQSALGLYRQRYGRSAQALADGDLTVDVTGADLTALLDASSQVSQLRQAQAQARQDLNALLGLTPDQQLTLATPEDYSALPQTLLARNTAQLAARRPDLLALKAGYASQEAKVRQAILGQFPALTVGVNRQRDTSAVDTLGFTVGLTLPLFNANRGAIATERASRKQLRAEYQARLDAIPGAVARLRDVQKLLLSQQSLLQKYLPALQDMTLEVRAAYDRGDVGALLALTLENTLLTKRIEALDVIQQLWNTRYALETLLAIPPGQWPEQ